MTITTNCNIRFLDNNYAEDATATYSSQQTAYPFSNVLNKFRSRIWKPAGNFTITVTNYKIYINDGADKTITLTTGNYTYATLASHIQTQLNASSTNWTCTYNSSTTFKFTIAHTGSATLRFSQTSDSIWSTLGYIGSTDVTATSWVADAQRNHTSEYVIFDLTTNPEITAFCLIGPLEKAFTISTSATIKIYANNVNSFTSAPIEKTLTRTDGGIFYFFDDVADSAYRYWKFEIIDLDNPLGPEGLEFSHIYLGDYITLDNRNISRGFQKNFIDNSESQESESGALFFNEKIKYLTLDNMDIIQLSKTDRALLEALYNRNGRHTPFYISVDPRLQISNSIDELTRYVIFNKDLALNHIIADRFNLSFSLREVL